MLAAAFTSNTALADLLGKVFLPATVTGLPRDSVVNVTAHVTLNKTDLSDWAGHVPSSLMYDVDEGCGRCSRCGHGPHGGSAMVTSIARCP